MASSITRVYSYREAIHALNCLQSNAGLLRSRTNNIQSTLQFAERMGIHIEKLKVVHVSGTKGKGSTCALLESILHAHNLKTGFYSSPHLVAVRERIRINTKPLSEEKFADCFWRCFNLLEKTKPTHGESMPPYFVFLTLIAYQVFLEQQVDVAIMETGIGGMYDCTNVISQPVVCGVTSIGFDHEKILGNTLAEIAWHKAGIFKPGVPAVIAPQKPDATRVIAERAHDIGMAVAQVDTSHALVNTDTRAPIKLSLAGCVQHENAWLAAHLARIFLQRTGRRAPDEGGAWTAQRGGEVHRATPFPLTEAYVKGMESCRWPGRNQRLTFADVTFYLDGAHTPESMQQCADWYNSETRRSKDEKVTRVLLFASTGQRRAVSLISHLARTCRFDLVVISTTALSPEPSASPDATKVFADKSEDLERVSTTAAEWRALMQRAKGTAVDLATVVQAETVHEALYMITAGYSHDGFDRVTKVGAITDGPLVTAFDRFGPGKLEVLVCGSVHLVGGVLSFIDPQLTMSYAPV